jgi:hypothetical protein
LLLVKRWLPTRQVVAVADQSFAALELLHGTAPHLTVITRLRLDAALYDPAPERRRPGQRGRTPKKGDRQPSLLDRLADPDTRWTALQVSPWYGEAKRNLEVATGTAVWYSQGQPVVPLRWTLVKDPTGQKKPKAFLCTDLEADPLDILRWFVRRWTVEVTFEEVRRHLGVETQRQWSEQAIRRTTPCLLALFSMVTLMADQLAAEGKLPIQQAAWYKKTAPTFSDALGAVRLHLWKHGNFFVSGLGAETVKISVPLYQRLLRMVGYTT